MRIENSLLDVARQHPSPNYDDRPDETDIDLIVVHGISLPPADFGGPWIDQLFTNTLDPEQHAYFREIHDQRVSSHLLIRRDGEIIQYVPFDKRAWHAGESSFAGRPMCNDYAIGIELEGTDDIPYEAIQYENLADVIACIMSAYPSISLGRVTGHCDVSPGRKTDPGELFDWHRLYALLKVHGL